MYKENGRSLALWQVYMDMLYCNMSLQQAIENNGAEKYNITQKEIDEYKEE